MKRKAPGNDQIYIDQFKYLGHRGKDLMLEIANKIWEKGQIPDKWKEATMIPILKKDKPAKDPTSYRPISLLPVGIKIIESMVLQKLNPYLEERKLILLSQTGIVDRKDSRRASFILKNADSPLIRHGETSVYSSGRRIRTKRLHKDRHTHKAGWKTKLKLHKPHIFFSDIGQAADLAPEDHSISQLMHPEAFPVAAAGSANTPSTAGAGCSQKNLFPIIRRFNIKPA